MLTGIKALRASILGRLGGFSYRYISSSVFEVPFEEVGMKELREVGRHLRYERISVRDYRNGKTKESQDRANLLLGRRSRKRGNRLLKVSRIVA